MDEGATTIQRTYLLLTLLTTLATSLIWGVNTLFLLDAGLSNTEAFTANAFFTLGMVLFEVPTGVLADTRGRRASYLLGTATLLVTTLLYLAMWAVDAPLWGWALSSILIGLGFTFYSGATEAWVVDALRSRGFEGDLDATFGRAQIVSGAGMLVGSLGGGLIAQASNLGVPYLIRAALLLLTFVVAWIVMHDEGFTRTSQRPAQAIRQVVAGAATAGFANRPVRWLLLAAPFSAGSGLFVFYALQPYVLELSGRPDAYGVAGLAAAMVAGGQIVGGLLVPRISRVLRLRTNGLILLLVLSVAVLVTLASTPSLGAALALVAAWSLTSALAAPLRQSFLNGAIPSGQRATVLSVDSLMGSSGGVVTQPALGRVADVGGYPASLVASAAIQAVAIPFIVLARREHAASDPIADPLAPKVR